ncbi:MAG: hypothetical protein NVS3B12_09470 [Acidimicrobiales bacterium]
MDGPAMAARFGIAQAGFSLADDIRPAPASRLCSSFDVQGLPITVLYDAEGRRVYMFDGELTEAAINERLTRPFGITVDAQTVATLVIPVVPAGAFELLRAHATDPSYTPVDARTPGEFAAGHFPGSRDLDMNVTDTQSALNGSDRDGTYLVFSNAEGRSEKAATFMHDLGFKHVYQIPGGLQAWTVRGLPIQQS